MKKLLVAFLFLTGSAFSQTTDGTPYIDGQVLISVDDNSNINKIIHDHAHINGVGTELSLNKLVSKPVNVWLLDFNSATFSHEELLEELRKDSRVTAAQNNHIVKERITTPNDPNFSSQWHHVNGNDADIDSDLAWDITTGGTTPLGDEIVVCVLEGGGADWDHPDLIDNHWVNTNEIPNNGIDDDNNGYVDDYNGWNTTANSDVISAGSHGTQVSGMIGATGDNGLLVAGINWDVKIMQVDMGGVTESEVIGAYTYPLVMRQMYTASGGTEGAFVVATNASWGIDGADPANYPLWCNFYDTLGAAGILNCGATTNSNFNVDTGGDMPTACGSDYMISVTRTGNTDNQAGGYGATTIDLGAPGINVVTTSNGGGSGSTTGTSFSSPLTAGVIALLYSAPCTSLGALALSNPQQAADQVRLALLDGVDPVSSLNGITVTGGRLNAFNSINEILNNCSATSCLDPWQLAASNVTDVQADITWGGTGTSYNLRYRVVGAGTWNTANSVATNYTLTGLTACTDYEVQVQSVCTSATDTSNFTSSVTFQTDGCCEPPATHQTNNIANTSADVSWSSVLAANSYNLRYKETAGATWTDVMGVTSPHSITGLTACTEYEVQIQTVCGSTTTSFTSSDVFTTAGCGACFDLTYCSSEGASTQDEWIESFQMGAINNVSGDDDGYGDYSGLSTDIAQSATVNFTVAPGYAGFPYSEYFNIWIDYDHNGDFTGVGEHVFDAGGLTTSAVNDAFIVPATATLGITKMRVSMKYNGTASECEGTTTFEYGEVEDYCVNIVQGNGIQAIGSLNFGAYPNPTNGVLNLTLPANETYTLQVTNALGQNVQTIIVQQGSTLDLQNYVNGIYTLKLIGQEGSFGIKRIVKQ